MVRIWRKLTIMALTVVMIVTMVPLTGSMNAYADEQEPTPIQDTYEIDGVTYYNTGSAAFATKNPARFYKELLGTRTEYLKNNNKDWSMSDMWLGLALGIGYYYNPGSGLLHNYNMLRGFDEGEYYEPEEEGKVYGRRIDPVDKGSLKDAEDYMTEQIFGSSISDGYFKDQTGDQPVIVAAVNSRSLSLNEAAVVYFSNFRVAPILPEDKGSNYVTTELKNETSSIDDAASSIKNDTAQKVSAKQSISSSTSVSATSSVNGSESYSYSESIKFGAGYDFTPAFKASMELGFTASQAVQKGWETSDSMTNSQSTAHEVSVDLPPYTQGYITQKTTEAENLTKYNCPIALKYDVTIVYYFNDHYINDTGDTVIIPKKASDPADKMVFTFSDQTGGARGDIAKRIAACPDGVYDDDGLSWGEIPGSGVVSDTAYVARSNPLKWETSPLDYLTAYVPMSPTGASFKETMKVISSEVREFQPLYPLYRVKIADPDVAVISDEVDYDKFSYYTRKMETGDYSYANYMTLEGLNAKGVAYYGFNKDNGYWIVTDKEGNELDPESAPVTVEKDPVSKNWRYTAVKPGTCFLVYRINEGIYATADAPDDYIKNDDLDKTAALEIIVSDKVAAPAGKTLTYSGKTQTGVAAGENYTVTGNTAVNAGSYEATASLKDKTHYTWADGTTADKKIKWTIAPKKITPGVTLSAAAFTWNGKARKPAAAVKDGQTKLASSSYTLTYASGRKNVGKYSVKVTLKGNYTGSRTVNFKIRPKGTSLSRLTRARRAIKVKWRKQASKMSASRITGYQVQAATNKKFTKNKKTLTVKGYKKVSKKMTGLKGGKRYYVRIRTYKTVSGVRYYSPWSKVRTVKTKK